MQPVKARGAISNPKPRFDAQETSAFDDGWSEPEAMPAPTTELILQPAKSIIATNDSPDVVFDQSINPYRGCEHDISPAPLCSQPDAPGLTPLSA